MKTLFSVAAALLAVFAVSAGTPHYMAGFMKPPVLNGRIEDAEWADALKLQGFYKLNTGKFLSAEECNTYIGSDGKDLFIAVSTTTGDEAVGGGLVSKALRHDDPVYKDDSVEFHLSPDGGKTLYQYIVNAKGAVWDCRTAGKRDAAWNGNLRCANLNESGRWNLECRIPLSDLGVTQLKKLSFSICRNWQKYGPSTAIAAAGYKELHVLSFREDSPVIREGKISGMNENSFHPVYEVRPRSTGEKIQIRLILKGLGDETYRVYPKNWNADPRCDGEFLFVPDEKGNFVRLCCGSGPESCFSKPFSLKSGDKLELSWEARGKCVIPGIIAYSAKRKYQGALRGENCVLDSSWKRYTSCWEIPGLLPRRKEPCTSGKVLFESSGMAELRNVKLKINGKKIDIYGNFAQSRHSGFYSEEQKQPDRDNLICFDQKFRSGLHSYCADFSVFADGKEVMRRRYAFDTGSSLAEKSLHPAFFQQVLPGGLLLSARNYPGTKKFVFELLSEKPFVLTTEKAVLKNHSRTFSAPFRPAGNNRYLAVLDFAEKSGAWQGFVQGGKKFPSGSLFTFEAKSFPWENNNIGIGDEVIPPFVPIMHKGKQVSLLLRQYDFNSFALWDQIHSMEQPLLASPMTLEAVVDGKKAELKGSPAQFSQPGPGKLVVCGRLASGKEFQLALKSVLDCDGFLWTTGRYSGPANATLDKLTLRFTVRKEHARLFHALADQIRTNPSGAVPEGQGLVWDSSKVERRAIRGFRPLADGLTSYFWIGGPMRGVCWCLESGKGYHLSPKVPQIRMERLKSGNVQISIDVVSKKVKLHPEGRSFSFGLQGTPVKLRPDFFKKLFLCNGERRIDGMFNLFSFVNFRAQGNIAHNAEPINQDYSLIREYVRASREKQYDLSVIKRFHDKNNPAIRAVISANLGDFRGGSVDAVRQREEKTRTIYSEFSLRNAGISDATLLYSNPKLNMVSAPETLYYQSEWTSPIGRAYSATYRTFPTRSHIDYRLWVYQKHLDLGVAGFYLDDMFLHPGQDVFAGQAEVDEDGIPHCRTSILGLRELVRRMAVLQYRKKISPCLTMIHATNGFLIPCFSFADILYGWETEYGQKPHQQRFTPEYILTESTGLQAGMQGAVLAGIQIPSTLSPKEGTALKKRLTRTLLACALTFDLQTSHGGDWDTIVRIRKILQKFGVTDPECRFIGFWDAASPVTSSPDILCSCYRKGNTVLAIGCSWCGEKRFWDPAAGKKYCNAVDLETGEKISFPAELPGYDFRLIQFELQK